MHHWIKIFKSFIYANDVCIIFMFLSCIHAGCHPQSSFEVDLIVTNYTHHPIPTAQIFLNDTLIGTTDTRGRVHVTHNKEGQDYVLLVTKKSSQIYYSPYAYNIGKDEMFIKKHVILYEVPKTAFYTQSKNQDLVPEKKGRLFEVQAHTKNPYSFLQSKLFNLDFSTLETLRNPPQPDLQHTIFIKNKNLPVYEASIVDALSINHETLCMTNISGRCSLRVKKNTISIEIHTKMFKTITKSMNLDPQGITFIYIEPQTKVIHL